MDDAEEDGREGSGGTAQKAPPPQYFRPVPVRPTGREPLQSARCPKRNRQAGRQDRKKDAADYRKNRRGWMHRGCSVRMNEREGGRKEGLTDADEEHADARNDGREEAA